MQVWSFPPIENPSAKVLILGSMPGKASLVAEQYYAHPRNLFWPLMENLFGIERAAPYAERCAGLSRHGLALWDVLKTCTRASSLDSDIVEASIEVNDFASLFASHPQLQTLCFNGAKAQQAFERYVSPELLERFKHLRLIRLPSTSPANASIPADVKLARWREALL